MRKMHELKIPDIIINAINEGGHAMDSQIVCNGDGWAYNRGWGKSDILKMNKGQLVLIEYISTDSGITEKAIGYISKDGDIAIRIDILGGMTIISNNAILQAIYIVVEPSGEVHINDINLDSIVGFEDDTINIFKL